MNERKGHPKRVRNRRGALCSSGIRADNHGLLVVWDAVLDVFAQKVAAVEIVDGNVEEALVLRIVEIHGDNVVCACASEEICNEGTGLRDPLPIAWVGLEGRRFCGVLCDPINPIDAIDVSLL